MDIDAIDRQVRKLTAFMERMDPIVIAFEAYQSAKAKTELDEDEETFSPAVEPHEDDDHNDITKIKNPMTAEETRQAIMRMPVYVEEANPSIILPQPEAVDDEPVVEPIEPSPLPLDEAPMIDPIEDAPQPEVDPTPVEETPVSDISEEALDAPDVVASTATDEKAATEPTT